jgi:hypothetical protein
VCVRECTGKRAKTADKKIPGELQRRARGEKYFFSVIIIRRHIFLVKIVSFFYFTGAITYQSVDGWHFSLSLTDALGLDR